MATTVKTFQGQDGRKLSRRALARERAAKVAERAASLGQPAPAQPPSEQVLDFRTPAHDAWASPAERRVAGGGGVDLGVVKPPEEQQQRKPRDPSYSSKNSPLCHLGIWEAEGAQPSFYYNWKTL